MCINIDVAKRNRRLEPTKSAVNKQMYSDNIYHSTNAVLVKESIQPPEMNFNFRHEEAYEILSDNLNKTADSSKQSRIPVWKIDKLYGFTESFLYHWLKPTQEANNNMIWTAGHCNFSRMEILILMLAWQRFHGRTVKQVQWHEWIKNTFEPIWNQLQPILKERNDKYNKNRREKYKEKKKMSHDGRNTNTKEDILSIIKTGRTTAQMLVEKLELNRFTVASQLTRLVEAGLVVKVGRGLYQINETK